MHKMVLYGIRLVGAGVATLWTNESGEHWLKVMIMRWRLDWRFVLRNYPASCQQDFHLCPGSESELWLHQPPLECKIAQQRGGVLGQISPACWHCIQSPTSNLTQTWHQFFTRLSPTLWLGHNVSWMLHRSILGSSTSYNNVTEHGVGKLNKIQLNSTEHISRVEH